VGDTVYVASDDTCEVFYKGTVIDIDEGTVTVDYEHYEVRYSLGFSTCCDFSAAHHSG
jgi:hypothetical protein